MATSAPAVPRRRRRKPAPRPAARPPARRVASSRFFMPMRTPCRVIASQRQAWPVSRPSSADSLDRKSALRFLHGVQEDFFERAALRPQDSGSVRVASAAACQSICGDCAVRHADEQQIVAQLRSCSRRGCSGRRTPPGPPSAAPRSTGRGAASDPGSCPAARSRPLPSTTTWSQTASTSGSRWLEKIRLMPLLWARSRASSRTSSRPAGSMPLVGSSRIKQLGIVNDGRGELEPLLHAGGVRLDRR